MLALYLIIPYSISFRRDPPSLGHTLRCFQLFFAVLHKISLPLPSNIHLTDRLIPPPQPLTLTGPHSPTKPIPKCRIQLAKIRLDAPTLVMYIMIQCALPRAQLKWVPGDTVPAVVVCGFEGRERGEED